MQRVEDDPVPGRSWVKRRRRSVSERFVAGNRIRLLRDGAEAFPAMLEAIASAKRQVLFEMYWFDSDRIGRRFAQAFLDARARGVEVAIIYDSIGSILADRSMFDELSRAGIGVIEYNPLAPWKKRFRLARLTRRDHRKILVIDGHVGFTGGLNIADHWLPEAEEGGAWRDDMIRVEGPAVRGFVRCFLHTWRRQAGPPLSETYDGDGEAPPERRSGEHNPGQRVRVLGEGFFRTRHTISRAYLDHLRNAEKRAWIANSYFVPDRVVIRALVGAARRGVDVRIIVPDESDIPIANWASRAVWARLLSNGVRIYQWSQSILHSKSAVIDGRWSTIGTFNLDHLSLRVNLEVNATVLDEGFAQTLEASFLRDFELCHEVDFRTFQYRSLGARLLELIAYRFRKLL